MCQTSFPAQRMNVRQWMVFVYRVHGRYTELFVELLLLTVGSCNSLGSKSGLDCSDQLKQILSLGVPNKTLCRSIPAHSSLQENKNQTKKSRASQCDGEGGLLCPQAVRLPGRTCKTKNLSSPIKIVYLCHIDSSDLTARRFWVQTIIKALFRWFQPLIAGALCLMLLWGFMLTARTGKWLGKRFWGVGHVKGAMDRALVWHLEGWRWCSCCAQWWLLVPVQCCMKVSLARFRHIGQKHFFHLD